jgi:hypothetical protein
MLDFAAKEYVELAHNLALIMASIQERQPDEEMLGRAMNRILGDAEALGLPVTKDQIGIMILEFVEDNPDRTSLDADRYPRIKGGTVDRTRFAHHIESVYSILKSELGSIPIRAIPREKAKYLAQNWLTNTPLFSRFPDVVDEFQRAGRCFAYDENVACVFHLMRVTDFCLRRVAESLPGVTYDARNWQGIGHAITKEMEKTYQSKTDAWKASEPFYAEVLTDIQAIGRGHRNPALHELEKKYDEREARYMLTIIESFANRVAEKL